MKHMRISSEAHEESPMRPPAKWAEVYMKHMKKKDVPWDWQKAAKYHVNFIHHRPVKDIRALNWYPTHVDDQSRIIDQADVWCSCTIKHEDKEDETVGVMVEMGKDVTFKFFPGIPGKDGPPRQE